MATTQVSSDVPRPSFAKIAASTSKDSMPATAARRVAAQARAQQPPMSPSPIVVGAPVIANGGVGKLPAKTGASPGVTCSTASTSPTTEESSASRRDPVDQIAVGTKNLSLGPRAAPSLVVNGSGIVLPEKKAVGRDTGSDDSQKADSTSDLGTKPPSLDGKSITSGTTFALDEKESLRPDDSASVKAAAAEDDDAFSIQNSMIAGSRMGSDVAPRVRGIQLGDIAERRPVQPVSGPQGMITPQSASSGQQPMVSVAGAPDALNAIYRQAPDDKLLEAMQSPKDRFFLLRLEKYVVDFVQQSKEPYMDLPPCNSFCRMLTHKLADYYHMTHSYEQAIGAVRIFRTPFCRVPPSLASIVESASAGSTPPPAVLPRKIMRRGEDGEMAASSTGPSKPTSETGSDAKDKTAPTKEKMSREEREEAYNRARERIFGNSEKTGESTPETDENGISRASSVSIKDKANGKRGKVERRRRDSGTFETRNQYAAYYPHPQQPGWQMGGPPPQPQYVPIGSQMPQFNGQPQAPYTNQVPVMFSAPNQNFGAPAMPGAGYPQYNNVAQYPQPAPQRFPPPNSGMAGYGVPGPSPPHQPVWQPPPAFNNPPSPYQPRGAPPPGPGPGPGPGAGAGAGPAPAPVPAQLPGPATGPPALGPPAPGLGPTGIPYAYGQLPVNANPHDPKSQHPIPGSYNRHAFNPSTKSFVPSSGVPPMQGQTPPYAPAGSHHGSPQVGSPHLAYAGGYQPNLAPPPMPPQPYGGGAGYAMARQGSNNSLGPYHHPPQHAQVVAPPMPPAAVPQQTSQHLPPHPPQIPNKPPVPQGPGQQYSHLPPHYGNPATLPPKPS